MNRTFKQILYKKGAAFVVYVVAFVVLLFILNWIGILTALRNKIKGGSSIEIGGILKLGESNLIPKVNINYALPIMEFDFRVSEASNELERGSSLKSNPLITRLRKKKTSVSKEIYNKVKELTDDYNNKVKDYKYNSLVFNENHIQIFKSINGFLKDNLNPFMKDYLEHSTHEFKKTCDINDETKHFILSFIISLYMNIEIEQNHWNEEQIDIKIDTEEFLNKIINYEKEGKHQPKTIIKTYLLYIKYILWFKTDDKGNLIDSNYYIKAINRYKDIINSIVQGKINDQSTFFNLVHLVNARLKLMNSQRLQILKEDELCEISNTQNNIIHRLNYNHLHKNAYQSPPNLNYIMDMLFTNQLVISKMYFNCNTLFKDFRVQKAIDNLMIFFDYRHYLSNPNKLAFFYQLGKYHEMINKYKEAKRYFDQCKNYIENQSNKDNYILKLKQKLEIYSCLCRIELAYVRESFYNKKYSEFESTISKLEDSFGIFDKVYKEVLVLDKNNKKNIKTKYYERSVNTINDIIEIAKGCNELIKYKMHPILERDRLDRAKYYFFSTIRNISFREIGLPGKKWWLFGNKEDLRVKARRWLGYAYFLEAQYGKNQNAVDNAIKHLIYAEEQIQKVKKELESKSKDINDKKEINPNDLNELKKNYLIRFGDDLEIYRLLCEAHLLKFRYHGDKKDKEQAMAYLEKYEKYLRAKQICVEKIEDT